MHSGGRRRRGQRILYYFRTPPAIRVGRAPIDEEAIRLLEASNPDIVFEWERILRPGSPNPQPERRERRERREHQPPAPSPQAVVIAEPVEAVEAVESNESLEPEPENPVEPRYSRLGREGLTRLRARYAEVMARISEKELEEAQRDELKSRAERLNPDGWVTEDEVTAALEEYEAVFESLRAVVGRHSRRQRL